MRIRFIAAWITILSAVLVALAIGALALVPHFFGDEPGIALSPVEQDLCVLDSAGSAGILVGGDSRAKYNLVPSILEEETGRKCVNIAEPITFGGDLSTLVKVLRKHPQTLANHPILLLSVNLESLNDLGFTGRPIATMLDWTPWDHFRVATRNPRAYPTYFVTEFIPSVLTLIKNRWKQDAFRCSDVQFRPPALLAQQGYVPFEKLKSEKDLYMWPSDERRYLLNGARRKAFEKALQWLSDSQAQSILIYQAPMDTAWIRRSAGSRPLAIPAHFSDILKLEAVRYPRIKFLDLYPNSVPGLKAENHFADFVHLNPEGAVIFSHYLGKMILTGM